MGHNYWLYHYYFKIIKPTHFRLVSLLAPRPLAMLPDVTVLVKMTYLQFTSQSDGILSPRLGLLQSLNTKG